MASPYGDYRTNEAPFNLHKVRTIIITIIIMMIIKMRTSKHMEEFI